jgi:hypothetical protein
MDRDDMGTEIPPELQELLQEYNALHLQDFPLSQEDEARIAAIRDGFAPFHKDRGCFKVIAETMRGCLNVQLARMGQLARQ